MVLTGKQALDYSGGVSAEDNFGIGGYDRIMGPNGQAPVLGARPRGRLRDPLRPLRAHLRRAGRALPAARGEHRPGRPRRPQPSRTTPRTATSDRRRHLLDGDEPRAQEALRHPRGDASRRRPGPPATRALGGDGRRRDAPSCGTRTSAAIPCRLLGIESRPLRRSGFLPADGPDQWTAGTLFPQSSKKVARAINAASGNRPLVVLANLSGFDGSPESMRKLQLEYGAEIGRAVVNFDGPIVFCVVSRYHGGAFVVFSGALNDNMEVIAVEGSYASVIGGAPAAAVVFAREVNARTDADPRVVELEAAPRRAPRATSGPRCGPSSPTLRAAVRSEKLGEVAAEFDAHPQRRARAAGRLDRRDHPGRARCGRTSSRPSSGGMRRAQERRRRSAVSPAAGRGGRAG